MGKVLLGCEQSLIIVRKKLLGWYYSSAGFLKSVGTGKGALDRIGQVICLAVQISSLSWAC